MEKKENDYEEEAEEEQERVEGKSSIVRVRKMGRSSARARAQRGCGRPCVVGPAAPLKRDLTGNGHELPYRRYNPMLLESARDQSAALQQRTLLQTVMNISEELGQGAMSQISGSWMKERMVDTVSDCGSYVM